MITFYFLRQIQWLLDHSRFDIWSQIVGIYMLLCLNIGVEAVWEMKLSILRIFSDLIFRKVNFCIDLWVNTEMSLILHNYLMVCKTLLYQKGKIICIHCLVTMIVKSIKPWKSLLFHSLVVNVTQVYIRRSIMVHRLVSHPEPKYFWVHDLVLLHIIPMTLRSHIIHWNFSFQIILTLTNR